MKPTESNTSNEWQALCAALRQAWDEVHPATLHRETFTQLAIYHDVAPWLAHQLHRHCPALLTDELQRYAQRNTIRAQFLTQTLLELLKAFQAAGLRTVPFKGPVLAAQLYGAPGLRDFCDLDVLVHPDDLAEAERLCVAQGFTHKNSLVAAHAADVRRFRYDLTLLRERDGILLELHWALTFAYAGIAFERLRWWERLQTQTLAGRDVATLPSEETLLLLCLHGSKDGWDKLKLTADVAQLLRVTPALDWQRLWDYARDMHAERLLRIALRLADDLLAAPLPASLRDELRADHSLRQPLQHVQALLHGERTFDETAIARHAFYLQTQTHWWERLRYCVHYAITPGSNEWGRVELPAALAFGYRLLRVARLTKLYGLRWLNWSAAGK